MLAKSPTIAWSFVSEPNDTVLFVSNAWEPNVDGLPPKRNSGYNGSPVVDFIFDKSLRTAELITIPVTSQSASSTVAIAVSKQSSGLSFA